MEKVREEGFLIVERKTMKFTRRLAEKFYEQHRNKASRVHYFVDLCRDKFNKKFIKFQDYFLELVNYMISGEVVAVCLARKEGIERWKAVMGPPDVR